MTTKEMIGIMQASEDGKLIEYRLKNPGEEDTWTLISTPSWDWVTYDYRIKPKDSYRPYKDASEFLDHLATECNPTSDNIIPGVWLKNIHTGKVFLVLGYDTDNIYIADDTFSFKSAFLHFTYTSGAPFGIKE